MPLIECIDCGCLVSDRAEACPSCGCPVSVIIEEKTKRQKLMAEAAEKEIREKELKNRPIPLTKTDIDLFEVKRNLLEKISPLVNDARSVQNVEKSVQNYLEACGSKISPNAAKLLFDAFQPVFDDIQSFNKYRAKDKQQKLHDALQQYNAIQAKTYQGPGFSIITNDTLSMAAYSAMNIADAKRFYRKQDEATNKLLNDFFEKNNNDNSVSDMAWEKLVKAVDFVVVTIGDMVIAKNTLVDYLDYYLKPDKLIGLPAYENHKQLYSVLKGNYICDEFIQCRKVTDEEKAALFEAESEGYLFVYTPRNASGTWCFTMGKLEEELKKDEYYSSHPEEYEKRKQQKNAEIESLYQAAESAFDAGLYYKAATGFARCGDYNDAIESFLYTINSKR